MHGYGIHVRDRSSDPGCEGCVRITIGTTEQMDRTLAALEATVRAMSIGKGSLA
jgi:histidinol-phosphate aminotransferase